MKTLPSRRDVLGRGAVAAVAPALLAAGGGRAAGAQPPEIPQGVKDALRYVAGQHDRFHDGFIVFDDHGSGGCHLFPSGWMGDVVPPKGRAEPKWVGDVLDERYIINPADGPTCLKVEYPAAAIKDGTDGWAAVAWESHRDAQNKPVSYDLRRYLRGVNAILTFRVRGLRGGELVEFKGHKSWDPQQPLKLTAKWQTVKIPLAPAFFDQPVTEAFVWAASRANNPNGCTFFLDEIRIQFGNVGAQLRKQEPRFVRSYCPAPTDTPDKHFRNVCFAYDQALAISALVATGRPEDLARARLIGDAIVYASGHDRAFNDGRIRNGYICGDLAGIGRNGPEGPTRLPGWWDFEKRKWFEDAYFAGSDCGNTAWVVLGLLNLWAAAGRKGDARDYLETAQTLGEWVAANAYREDGLGGFAGGLEGFEPRQTKSLWRSTEHNIDLHCVYARLAAETAREQFGDRKGDAQARKKWEDRRDARAKRFEECGRHAERFVGRMRDEKKGFLYTGSKEDGESVNKTPIPLDVQAWSLLAFRDKKLYGPAVEWADKECRVALGERLFGFDFDTDKDAVWFEGTGQMSLAYRLLGRDRDADACLRAIREVGVVKDARAPREAHGGVYAASRDGLTTGFFKEWGNDKADPWVYYRRAHLGATCWYVFAELAWNPYWGEAAARLP